MVFDTVGGEIWRRSWRVIRPGGTLVSVAVPRPPVESAPAGVRAVWFVVASRPADLTKIAELIDAGAVRPIVSETLPLDRGAEGFASGRHGRPGKIVIDVA